MIRNIITLTILLYGSITYAQIVKPVVLIQGNVYNERNMHYMEARIIYEILPEGNEAGIARTNPANGSYKIILPYGRKYGYYALAEGYYSVTKYLDVTDLTEYTEIDEQNLYLAPVEPDQVIRINNIFFKKGTAELKLESFAELNRFVEFLKVNKKVSFEIAGHTDNTLSDEASLQLSMERAQAVADYLISHKIKDSRITVKGYGSSQPVGFNNNKEGKALNNRIECVIKGVGSKQ